MVLTNRILLLAIAIAIFGSIWMVRDIISPTPFDVKYELSQIDALAAAARADAIGEKPEKRGAAQDYIIDTMLRYVAQHPKATAAEVLSNALTLYPEGWQHRKMVIGRNSRTIKYSPTYVGSSWDEAYKRAIDGVKRGTPKEGCATHYIRAKQRYAFFTNERKAAAELQRTMVRDPQQPEGLTMTFLCPKA